MNFEFSHGPNTPTGRTNKTYYFRMLDTIQPTKDTNYIAKEGLEYTKKPIIYNAHELIVKLNCNNKTKILKYTKIKEKKIAYCRLLKEWLEVKGVCEDWMLCHLMNRSKRGE